MVQNSPWSSDTRVDDSKQDTEKVSATPPPGDVQPNPNHTGDATQSNKENQEPRVPAEHITLPIPPGAELPDMGWRGFQQRRAVKKQVEDPANPGFQLVYLPGKKERAIWDERDRQKAFREAEEARTRAILEAEEARVRAILEAEEARVRTLKEHHAKRVMLRQMLVRRLKFLAAQGVQPVIVIANSKSAGKTSTAIGVGTAISEHTRKVVVALPSTANTATVTIGMMAGIPDNALTVEELLLNIDLYGSYRTLDEKLPRTDWGLGVVIESSRSSANDSDDALIAPYMKAIDATLPNVSALILDLGNDNISRTSIALQAARLGHVLVFPFMLDAPVTHGSLSTTMKAYSSDNGIPEDVEKTLYGNFANRSATGLSIPTPEKVRTSILVATRTNPEEGVNFKHFASSGEQNSGTPDLTPWDGTGICVPNEPSIGRKVDGKLVPYDYDEISPETDIAYLEIAVACFEITCAQQGRDIGEPMVAHLPAHYTTNPPATPQGKEPS